MFVQMRLKTQGAVALCAAGLTLGACDDPTANTDLRPEGDPEVLAVLVMNDQVDGFLEQATFCKLNDAKRPGLVGIPAFGSAEQFCPEDLTLGVEPVTNALPLNWA